MNCFGSDVLSHDVVFSMSCVCECACVRVFERVHACMCAGVCERVSK